MELTAALYNALSPVFTCPVFWAGQELKKEPLLCVISAAVRTFNTQPNSDGLWVSQYGDASISIIGDDINKVREQELKFLNHIRTAVYAGGQISFPREYSARIIPVEYLGTTEYRDEIEISFMFHFQLKEPVETVLSAAARIAGVE